MYVLIAIYLATVFFAIAVIGPFNETIRKWVLKNLKDTLVHEFYDDVQDYISYDDDAEGLGALTGMYLFYLLGLLVSSMLLAALWGLVIPVLAISLIARFILKSIRSKNKQIKNKTK